MIRKFTHYLLLSVMWCSMVSCDDDEAARPPKPVLEADKFAAETGEEITFTIQEVHADAVSLLPYGLPGGDPGVPVTFTDGSATVTFAYARPGTFEAIVVTNNHSDDGEDIKNVRSEPVTITISSSGSAITEFRFIRLNETETATEVLDVSTETVIDEDAKTIHVTVPYGADISSLIAAYTASGYSTVEVSGAEQQTEETVNDFSGPVEYTVTADDGTSSVYTVTVDVTPVETVTTIKSITPLADSKSSEEKLLGVSVDNTGRIIVVYDTMGTPAAQFDSVRIGYELDGEFAILKYGDAQMDQDSLLNLTTPQELVVYSQDSASAAGIETYTVYAAAAPKLRLSFPDLVPDAAVSTAPVNFNLNISALKGTDESSIKTDAITETPAGVTVMDITVDGANFADGATVDYSDPVEFQLTVDDSNLGVVYTVTYTVTVTVIP